MSLLARLFVLVLIAVLPAIGIQAYSVVRLRAERAQEVSAEAVRLMQLVEGEQERLFEGVRQLAIAVAEASFVRTDEYLRCEQYLIRLSRRALDRQTVSVTDTAGKVLCSGAPEMTGRSLAGLPVLKRAMDEGRFTPGEWMEWPLDGEPVLSFGMPYVDGNGEIGGAVLVTLDLRWLADSLAGRRLSGDVRLTLADRNGTVLVQAPDTGRLGGSPLPEALRPLLRANDPGVAEVADADGTTRVVAHSPVRDGVHDLFVAVAIDRDAAMARIDRTTVEGVVMTVVGLVIAMLAAWGGGTLFVRRPVAALMRAVQGWRDGHSAGRADLRDGGSELGQLGRAFDDMAEALEARETALRGNERHLRAVLDGLPVFIAVLKPDGAVLHVNRAALSAGGLTADEVVGRPLDRIRCWAEDRPVQVRLRAAIDAAAAGMPSRFDSAVRLPGGRTVTVDITLTPMRSADGRVEHLIASGIDITERKRTEAALRTTEERFRTALTNSGAVVFSMDRDLRYTWIANPVLLEPERIIGRTDDTIFDRPEDTAALTAIKRRVVETGEPARKEVRICLHGRDMVFDLVVDPTRDASGAVVGVTCSAFDVTERHRDAEALRQARVAAEQANEAKSKFLAAASHDLRQPVQSLFLFAAALGERLKGHPTLPLLDNMRQSLDTLKTLLDSLLDMARLESGRISAVPVRLRLDDVIGKLAAEYGPRARQKGLELRVVRSGAWVTSDPALLDRILRNLIENALKYTRSGRVLLGARRAGGTVRLEVWDTGIGIPADKIDAIFEEFTQVNDTRTERGLGLGLAIVQRLARLLEHRVTVRSVAGRGSVFAVELPRAGAPAPTVDLGRPANDAPVQDPAKDVVLVIDDEAIILLGLKAMLEGWGYDVLAARSGDQALSLLEKDGRRPRLLLSDYQLQHGRTGPEALSAIQERVGHDVPGVILTGDASPERLAEAERNGYRLLHKPVLPSELRQVVGGA
ncbi:PAS domain-containing protein [Azospirillum sp. TSO22-1]|uniref:PAS domain-containing protein n=1 Tax=Azospirillum sp. TSO22-1 TaxID=716789 RepID=UPI000D6148D6|nr:PAS domain-containing protein [Azospirillum sp. TSO22-1]PWC54713.1 histidine kinase [Azospirillum sp. TSO22-1]